MCAGAYTSFFGKEPMVINKGCHCPIRWNNSDVCNEEDIIDHIELIECTVIL